MAYRRRHGISRSTTFKEEIHHPPPDDNNSPSSSLLASQAIRASAAHRDSSLSSAYGESVFARIEMNDDTFRSKSFAAYGDSTRSDSKSGFWSVLARKAKAIIEDENALQQFENSSQSQLYDSPVTHLTNPARETCTSVDNPSLKKGLDNVTSSLNQIGDTFEKAFEEGRTMVGNKTQELIQESWKLQTKRKENHSDAQNESFGANSSLQQQIQQQNQTNHETQLKASRDVAMATAAKAKLLLRELKTVKADLTFAKLRCSQLEEENKVLREGREKGGNAADDDLIRLQLEALLAEKARLAHENETYARENRFLREIVDYHQLTMQDVVYLDGGIDEVTEAYPIHKVSSALSSTPSSPKSPPSPTNNSTSVGGGSSTDEKVPPQGTQDRDTVSEKAVVQSSNIASFTMEDDQKRTRVSSSVKV